MDPQELSECYTQERGWEPCILTVCEIFDIFQNMHQICLFVHKMISLVQIAYTQHLLKSKILAQSKNNHQCSVRYVATELIHFVSFVHDNEWTWALLELIDSIV